MIRGHKYLLLRVLAGLMVILAGVSSYSQKPYLTEVPFNLPGKPPVFHLAVQDRPGYLWLASSGGLYRFDGINYDVYSFPDSSAVTITALHPSGEDALWIGCKDGRIFHLQNKCIEAFLPEEGTAQASISDFLDGDDGAIWWSTQGEGVYRYADDRVYNINHDDGLSDDFVYDLEKDASGNVLAATDNGISVISISGGIKKTGVLELSSSLPDQIVKTLVKEPSGRIWAGFQDNGAACLSPDAGQVLTFTSGWAYGPVQDAVFAGPGLWAAAPGQGIIAIGPDGSSAPVTFTPDRSSNPFGRIFQLLADREDNIWVLSSNGLFRTTGNRLNFLPTIAGQVPGNIHAVMNDSRGCLWFSTDAGLFCYDPAKGTSRQAIPSASTLKARFMCIREDRYGMVWAGAFDYGLVRIDPASGAIRRITEQDGLVNNNVLSLSMHNDTLWLATLGGATRIIIGGNGLSGPLDFFSLGRESGLGNTFIYDVYEDPLNRVWFATDGDGISMWDNGHVTSYSTSSGLKDDVIYSVTGDGDGNTWFSTATQGIYFFDGTGFRHFGPETGLRSTEISALEVIGNEVVVIHGLGMDVIHLPSFEISHFGQESGLGKSAPELNAISSDLNGRVWIGTENGIIRYQPGSKNVAHSPHTVLETMLVFLQPQEMTGNLSLRGSQNHISFTYTGLWLSDPDNVIYRVMLEGYDLGWKDTYDRMAAYSSLPPGTYTFRVQSSLDPAFRQASEASFTFTVRRPFWQQIWFIALAILALASLVYFYIRFRENRLRIIEARKKEKIEFEFQVLKNQVNPHFLFNSFSTLISLIEEDSRQASEYTEKLSDFFRQILQLKDNQVIRLEEEMRLIRDYLFIQGKRYGDLIRLDVSLDAATLNSSIPPMTLQMLMENAVKHNIISRDYPLYIKIFREGDRLVVQNNFQPKRRSETSTGIGLENISRRYRLLSSREISVENKDGFFRVMLPIL